MTPDDGLEALLAEHAYIEASATLYEWECSFCREKVGDADTADLEAGVIAHQAAVVRAAGWRKVPRWDHSPHDRGRLAETRPRQSPHLGGRPRTRMDQGGRDVTDADEVRRRNERALHAARLQLGNGTWNLNEIIRILEGET